MSPRVKYPLERIAKLDKHRGNSKSVKAKIVTDLDGSEAYTQGPNTTYLYPANTPRVKGIRGYGLAVGRKVESILEFSLKLFWGVMSCWDDISSKRSKYKLELPDASHKGR